MKTAKQMLAYVLIGAAGVAASVAVVVGEPARAEIAVASAATVDLSQAQLLLGMEN